MNRVPRVVGIDHEDGLCRDDRGHGCDLDLICLGYGYGRGHIDPCLFGPFPCPLVCLYLSPFPFPCRGHGPDPDSDPCDDPDSHLYRPFCFCRPCPCPCPYYGPARGGGHLAQIVYPGRSPYRDPGDPGRRTYLVLDLALGRAYGLDRQISCPWTYHT